MTAPADPHHAAALLAVDPAGLGGAILRARPGPARDAWLETLRDLLPVEAPLRRVPSGIADERLLGGLDLAGTLATGRPILARGLLAEADGGVLVLAMAERLPAETASRLAAVLDTGAVALARDGFSASLPARCGVIALDEGIDAEEGAPEALRDRLAFPVEPVPAGPVAAGWTREAIGSARRRLPGIAVGDDDAARLCATAASLGIVSLRASLLALRAARSAAALAGRDAVAEADLVIAVRLVLAPRATMVPEGSTEPPPPPDEPDTPPGTPPDMGADTPPEGSGGEDPSSSARDRDDILVAEAAAAIPAGLLAQLLAGATRGAAGARASGRAGAAKTSLRRGRPTGARAGRLGRGARLALVDTLRAAAPWQPVRRRAAPVGSDPRRVLVRPEDFRIVRFRDRDRTTVVFVVDASGSAALHRLAEAKGAISLLLAECYVRRDQVALLAFRDRDASLLLPPTGSLVRARRSLSALPGGGGTPLATAIVAAAGLADAIRRRGDRPLVVLLTDAQANIARDGTPGRARARADATEAARLLHGIGTLFVDTGRRPDPGARALADAMAARYLALPSSDAPRLMDAVRGLVG